MRITRLLLTITLVSVIAGCATTYTNNDLIDAFNSQGLVAGETEQGGAVFLSEVFFGFGEFDLTPAAQEKISAIAVVINDSRALNRIVVVVGHADAVGHETYNLNLSTQRAETVGEALVIREVARKRISTNGYGEKYPIALNTKVDGSDSPEGRAQNRRVEIIIENPSPL